MEQTQTSILERQESATFIRPFDQSTRPERRSALIAHELARLDVDIAALSEFHYSEEGRLREGGADYTFYWSGKSTEERNISGVGFFVRDFTITKLTNLPIGHSDRVISMRLTFSVQQYATFFIVYAPTLQPDPAGICFCIQTYAAFFVTFQLMTKLSSLPIAMPE